MPSQNTHFICEIQFLEATNVPVSDLRNLSCDPFIRAKLETFDSDDTVMFRTPTMRNTLNPVYNSSWIVSGIPSNGFILTCTLMDEEVVGNDKTLGKATIQIPDKSRDNPTALLRGFDTGTLECKVEKRSGGIRTHIATYIAFFVTRGRVSHHVRIWIRVRILDYVKGDDHKLATLGPPWYTRHFSPLIGHFVSGYNVAKNSDMKGKDGKALSPTTFVANRLQLSGPRPTALRFRYKAYNTFIGRLFTRRGFRGKFFHYALQRQYKLLYGYTKSTVYGVASGGELNTHTHKPMDEERSTEVYPESVGRDCECNLARQFLEMTCHGRAGRLFTYIITLDSELRFTETGEEFSIDFLSKHSMHSDAAEEIAFSGEFFIRRWANDTKTETQSLYDSDESITSDPKDYELVIDNSSGTYRPKKELLPVLQQWLSGEANFGALGKVTAIDGFDENLAQWKKERQEFKRQLKAQTRHHHHQ